MKILLIFSICLMSVAVAELMEHLLSNEWTVYKTIYNKNYTEDEDYWRRRVYEENRNRIINNNNLHRKKQVSYMMNINHMTDRVRSEINIMNGVVGLNSPNGTMFVPSNNTKIRPSVDWRLHGLVTEVRDQGYCGCCYAFAAAQALEAQLPKIKSEVYPLGIQNIVDCSTKDGNQGCNGGLMTATFNYILRVGGLEAEENNPYIGEEGTCKVNENDHKISISDYYVIEPGNEKALEQAVNMYGPIAAGMDASCFSFMFYKKGIYHDLDCSSVSINHAVLIVGYGTDKSIKKNESLDNSLWNGEDYWIVKNSWGTNWGEKGYFKLARGCNHCGISQSASYPVVNRTITKSVIPFTLNLPTKKTDKIKLQQPSKNNLMRTIIQRNVNYNFF